ncbi:putative nuclease HARBI1-like [Hibiscus syriacus]|uniref:Nuclease HARBI1-like n=1 Tax=Hibiscus syriacus TaxID=106335 RepID=A0A6A3C3F6_HIBSY|nr:putative nuclease HARBI1-like [Hibiscus syriacus]
MKRKPYGTSRRSILKKTFTQEQVKFAAGVSADPLVGIIGGGMAGLLCALSLEKRGVKSTVFDTLVDYWMEKGLVRQWQGLVGQLELGGQFVPLPSSPPRFIGANGMRPLADSLLSEASMVHVERPCWISKLEPFNGMWYLSENGKPRGQFDAIVIAHNDLDRADHAERALDDRKMCKSLACFIWITSNFQTNEELSSIWALLAAFEHALPMRDGKVTFEGAFVKRVDSVSWMANNSMKLSGSQSDGPHCWTFFSTAAYGKQNKVPQENIPTQTAGKVKTSMLEGVEAALGLSKGSLPRPIYSRVQLWGAALPTNTPGIPCIFDPHGRAGICGDWLLGSNLESAALSGMALGNHIADYLQSDGSCPEEFAVGLEKEFQAIEGHDIGQFAAAGVDSLKQDNQMPEFQLAS